MTESTILIAVLLSIMTFVVGRRYLLLPFVVAACFVPVDQRILIADLDFTVVRILVLVAVSRVFVRGEYRDVRWNLFDKMVLAWAVCGSVVYVIQYGDMRALIYKCGFLFDLLGLYWIFRQALRSWDDYEAVVKYLAVCALAMMPFVIIEFLTKRNVFAIIGTVTTEERMGRFRCQAAFPISILLGLFWAISLPFFAGMAAAGKNRMLYWVAATICVFMVIASASSTPMSTLLVVGALLFCYRWRKYTFFGWKLFFVSLIAMHIVMAAPVWHLIARMNVVAGSTGWQRYYLIDQAINHFGEWMLIGTRDTRHWGRGLTDVTNQYVLEGVRGGALTLGLFVAMLVAAFRRLGQFFFVPHGRDEQILVWCLFVSLCGHCIAFLGVSYFGQIGVLWYLTLAMVGFVAESNTVHKRTLDRVSTREHTAVSVVTEALMSRPHEPTRMTVEKADSARNP